MYQAKETAMGIQHRAMVTIAVTLLVLVGLIVLWMILRMDGLALLAWINVLCERDVQNAPSRPAFYCTDHVDWCCTLRSHYKLIQREFRDAMAAAPIFSEVLPEQWDLADQGSTGKWRVVILRLYGRDSSVGGFPKTRNLLCNIPGCTTAMFSVIGASHGFVNI